jgi:hypothetical protein
MLDRQCGKVCVRHQISVHSRNCEQLPKHFGVAFRRLGRPNRRTAKLC